MIPTKSVEPRVKEVEIIIFYQFKYVVKVLYKCLAGRYETSGIWPDKVQCLII